MKAYKNIIVEKEWPAATITLNRPEANNQIDMPMMEDWIDALRELDAQDDVRAIIIKPYRRINPFILQIIMVVSIIIAFITSYYANLYPLP